MTADRKSVNIVRMGIRSGRSSEVDGHYNFLVVNGLEWGLSTVQCKLHCFSTLSQVWTSTRGSKITTGCNLTSMFHDDVVIKEVVACRLQCPKLFLLAASSMIESEIK